MINRSTCYTSPGYFIKACFTLHNIILFRINNLKSQSPGVFFLLVSKIDVYHVSTLIFGPLISANRHPLVGGSVADPGCLSRIPDPNFYHPGFRIRIFFHPEYRIRIKEFKYFNLKNCFQALGNMIRVVHPGSRGQKGTGYRIRNTGWGVVYLWLRNGTAAASPGVQHNSVLLALLKQITTLRHCSSAARLQPISNIRLMPAYNWKQLSRQMAVKDQIITHTYCMF